MPRGRAPVCCPLTTACRVERLLECPACLAVLVAACSDSAVHGSHAGSDLAPLADVLLDAPRLLDAPKVADEPPPFDAPDVSDVPPPRCDGGVACGTACVDTTSDPFDCGACGRVCAAGTRCAFGVCRPAHFTCTTGAAWEMGAATAMPNVIALSDYTPTGATTVFGNCLPMGTTSLVWSCDIPMNVWTMLPRDQDGGDSSPAWIGSNLYWLEGFGV